MTAEITWYGRSGVDYLDALNAYTGYFYYVIPPLLLCVTVLLVGEILTTELLERALPARAKRWFQNPDFRKRGRIVVGLAAVSVLVLIGLTQVSFVNLYQGQPDLRAMTAALEHAAARNGRPAVAVIGAPFEVQSEWPVVAGVIVQASRTDLPACVDYPFFGFLFSRSEICSASEVADGYEFAVDTARSSIPPGWAVLWHDSTFTLYAKSAGTS
jgi:hypothetical protein